MKIEIETIPHQEHRYTTVGDWYYKRDGTLIINVSNMGDWRHEALVAVHELVEVLICKHRGISTEEVDFFDKQFEEQRKSGLHSESAEPGDDAAAPYNREHCIATGIERVLAAALDVGWNSYANEVESLPYVVPKI